MREWARKKGYAMNFKIKPRNIYELLYLFNVSLRVSDLRLDLMIKSSFFNDDKLEVYCKPISLLNHAWFKALLADNLEQGSQESSSIYILLVIKSIKSDKFFLYDASVRYIDKTLKWEIINLIIS